MVYDVFLSSEHLRCEIGVEGCYEGFVEGAKFGACVFAVSV